MRDRWDNELNIGDEVIFISRKFGCYLEKGYVVKMEKSVCIISHTLDAIAMPKNYLLYKIMNPITCVFKV